jgi:flagellar biosynthetic protein FlhB
MANDDKTEKPTPKRRKEAREKGQVAKSAELNGAATLGAGLIGVAAFGPKIATALAGSMRSSWSQIANGSTVTSSAGLHGLMGLVLKTLLTTLGPIAGIVALVAIVANVAQTKGIHFSRKALKPSFARLNPGAGAKRVFGTRLPFELGKTLAKVAVVGGVAAMTLVPMITHLNAGVGITPLGLGHVMGSSAKSVVMRVFVVYLLIALIDFVWQRRTVEKGLKMTKQEVKDESKGQDLPPEVRSAIRRRQVQAARARMMAAIPQADVVVTNPTHYAVALRYDGSKPAPIVVAKGKNLIAAQIRRIAGEHDVPIVPDPPLARSLHASVEIDQMIPAELYAAVAQVLAFVYRTAGRRSQVAA